MRDNVGQTLAQKGNGIAAYLDSLAANSLPAADNVKIQIEFNPAQVASYRLIGYETRLLNGEDFRDDRVDAGDMGSGQTVTALYGLTLAQPGAPRRSPRRYEGVNVTSASGANGHELANFSVRYKLPGQKESQLVERPIAVMALPSLESASEDVRFAVAVAVFGQLLSGGKYLNGYKYDQAINLAQDSLGEDVGGYRRQGVELMEKARKLSRR